jgi:hypothetical protein
MSYSVFVCDGGGGGYHDDDVDDHDDFDECGCL